MNAKPFAPPRADVALVARRLFASRAKAQEAIAHLERAGLSVVAHPSIHAISQVYRAHGVAISPRLFDGTVREGEVGVFPPFGRSNALRHHARKATAVLTGWAMEPNVAGRYGADVAFPLSDHADFEGLVKYAEATGAAWTTATATGA